ncbi:hypothetical protein DFJ58DRAFT_245329 [Suillus subalutaceus]|uniref:uncharacterized protein n=1 Tax=Suillus subalutaceus TaxID=48586 RepID=UPI001B85FB1B|nr:uncharacterized protein DFJ58DRAFT_245329 [Suillus subalutaceus]KAG1861727.1 hypothetical protein DFJ58DRAFT_245329 [Suillus subalutaceus]
MLKNASLEDLLLPIPRVLARKQPMNNNATRRPPIHARRIPPRFFDDMQGDIHSSTSRDVHPPSSHRILAPSIGSPRAFLARIPSLFQRSHFHTSDATELQQTPRQGIFSRRGRTVKVAAVRDRKSLFVAPRRKEMQQQSSQSHGQGSSSQSQAASTSTSTTQPARNTQATTPGVPTARSRLLTLLARLVLLICCAPLPSTDSH